ncbi:uncharacterized protein LOC120383810 isoform X2 [Mauremys reevesii]|uniref:uncharacterized protein LOC120383810 isoform X2 n=1 Tax=Mauremys reevesii TaxID=260615 RepID=UPI00193F8F83|nr:uncharacterized protein LOC120383810 isoform X2 [Mauremys reevesii]XP_039358011.1 uncharacterized protein LOC120383810 isoform X2 [Mauremys reevesii]
MLLCLLRVSQELTEELPKDSPPSAILANSLIAVGNLSTMKPALEPDLETCLLRAALRSVFTLGMEKETINIQISAEFPRMGHHVAQLALFVSDPDKDISRQAREGTYRLYLLLLQQRGLTIHKAEDLWCHDWHQDSRLLGYKNMARVGEVSGKFFSEGQRKYFLQTAMLAIHDPLLRVNQAGLLLIYSILGEAQQLMGDKLEDDTAKALGGVTASQMGAVRS